MNTYEYCRRIGDAGTERILPILEREYHGQALKVSGEGFQRRGGDAVVAANDGSVVRIEVKTEQRFTGNFFVEEWSDYLVTPGWGVSLTTDVLAYLFDPPGRLYLIPWPRFRSWLVSGGTRPVAFSYRNAAQRKYEQANRTTGVLVPISEVQRNVGFVLHDLSHGGRDEFSADFLHSATKGLFGEVR